MQRKEINNNAGKKKRKEQEIKKNNWNNSNKIKKQERKKKNLKLRADISYVKSGLDPLSQATGNTDKIK